MADKNFSSIHHVIKKMHQPAVPPPAVVGGDPEAGPRSSRAEMQQVVEIEPVHPEVQPHVEVRPETVPVPADLQKIGVHPVSTPQFTTTQGVPLPLSEAEIPKGLSAPVDSSFRWLAVFTMYLLEQSHVTVKSAHRGLLKLFKRY